MAKKQKVVSGIAPMSELVSATRGDLLELVSSSFETGRKAYVVAAKCCIALEGKLRKGETFYGILEAAGLKKSQIANGRQLAQVWNTWVDPQGSVLVGEETVSTGGKMSEEFFDNQLNYSLAVALNKLTRKNVGMAESFLARPEEWPCLAEHGMDTASYDDFKAKQAAQEAEAQRKADEARIEAKAKELAETETEAEETGEPTETESSEDTEPEVEETEPEVEAPTGEDTPPEVENNVTKFEGKKDNMPAFRNAIEKAEELAIEIAAHQPEKAEEARQALTDLVERMADVFDGIEVEETEANAATA